MTLSMKMNSSLVIVMMILMTLFTGIMIYLENKRFDDNLSQARTLLITLTKSELSDLISNIQNIEGGFVTSKSLDDHTHAMLEKINRPDHNPIEDIKVISAVDHRLIASWDGRIPLKIKKERFNQEIWNKLKNINDKKIIQKFYTINKLGNYFTRKDNKLIQSADVNKIIAIFNKIGFKLWPTDDIIKLSYLNDGNQKGRLDNLVQKDKKWRFVHTNDRSLLFYIPLKQVNEVKGYLYMKYDLNSIYEARTRSIFTLIGSVSIMILSVVASLTLLNRNMVVRPVKKISEEMKAVGNGDLHRHIIMKRSDEIGNMTQAFNTMVTGLKSFTQYVSKDVVQRILESGSSRIEGRTRKIAVFFSDIRSFTTITEVYKANEVVHMLNTYFSMMVPIIMNWHGNLDKFIGDAIMAQWGGSVESKDDPYHACMAALDQLKSLKEFNLERQNQNQFEVNVGMGINYGEAIAGTLGSEHKMEFTVIGDTVNLASRLESLTKEYGVDIIISEFVEEAVKEKMLCRELDKVAVKGKSEGVTIFELIGLKSQATISRIQIIESYQSALSMYKSRQFSQCIDYLNNEGVLKNDFASHRLKKLAQNYLINPPPDNWDAISYKTNK